MPPLSRSSRTIESLTPINMTSISHKISEFIVKHAMLNGSRGAIVAVSGGPDSVAILDILVRLIGSAASASADCRASQTVAEPQTLFGTLPGFKITVAHLNHKLRAEASEDDARFVSDLAQRLGLSAIVGVADVKALAADLKIGIEEAARAARYSFLFQAARVCGADRIVTGHSMNDQAETFVMRALRGSGAGGLAGMAAVRPAHQFDGLEITITHHDTSLGRQSADSLLSDHPLLLIRPALCLTREEIERYCRERSLAFREDTSNLSGEFTRNRIRHEVIPGLCLVEPQAIRSIARTMELLAADSQALEELADDALDRASRADNPYGAWSQSPGHALNVDVLIGQSPAILNRLIMKALRGFLSPGCEVTSTHISAVRALIHQGRSGKHVELPGGIRVWRQGSSIVVDNAPAADRSYEIELSANIKAICAGGFQIKLERKLSHALFASLVETARSDRVRTGRDWGMAVLDDDLVPESLIVRPRRPGERARVIGQSSPNKLKNLMISHRIPVSRRVFWPLASTGDGRYVWSPGMPPSVEFAANRESRALAILSATDG